MFGLRAGRFGLLALSTVLVLAEAESPSLHGLPTKLTWQNVPVAWNVTGSTNLTIQSGKNTDWFVDPFDGSVHNNAPILLSDPDMDFVLSARVKVSFKTKWDAGALMVWSDDHRWAKLSFELSPQQQPTMVTVVTRGFSDDCNSIPIAGETVYLQIAKSGPAYVFYSSTDDRSWHILRVFELGTGRPPRVGFESQSPAGEGTKVVFSDIRYSSKKIANIYNEPNVPADNPKF
jgi:uncharacterized protein